MAPTTVGRRKVAVHVEVGRNPKCGLNSQRLEELVQAEWVRLSHVHGCTLRGASDLVTAISDHLKPYTESFRVYFDPEVEQWETDALATNSSRSQMDLDSQTNGNGHVEEDIKYSLLVYVFELSNGGEEEEFMDDDDEDGSDSPASHSWILPSKSLDGYWDSLFFQSDIKTRLMEYVHSALLFSERGVSSTLITWNKVILLHGCPGSGKTTLCKALAQKAAIRLSGRYAYGQLIEINSHSLFSKWFSESGKLVMRMFEKIHQLIQDPKALVFLLIDEVESLAKCRRSAEAGNEPADSVRAVNALLTQIDRIKRYPNVMILTTSNIVGSIDLAFVDRADLKIHVGPPPPSVVYQIYASSLNELIRVGIIASGIPLPQHGDESSEDSNAKTLFQISKKSERMSGRTLRKIPFLTHANFVGREKCPLPDFLVAMNLAVEREWTETAALQIDN